MEDYQNKLFPYAYNIIGSSEDAKDAVQDVLEKHFSSPRTDIDNVIGYLVKAVINKSINIKKRKKKIRSGTIWLPEPIATEKSDNNIDREEILSYSMLVLLERLNPLERAVFILKEAFDYSHQEIANTMDVKIENSRKSLSRARSKLRASELDSNHFSSRDTSSYMNNYINVIKNGDVKSLEKMLSEDISVAADGGGKISLVRELTIGKPSTLDLLFYVFQTFQKLQRIRITEVNHQPALLFYQDDILVNCQVFKLEENNTKINQIYSILDPDKLKNII